MIVGSTGRVAFGLLPHVGARFNKPNHTSNTNS